MKFPPFEYLAAADLGEASAVLASDEDAKVLAGGQSLLPLMALRLARPSVLVDLGRVGAGSVDVVVDSGVLSLGSLTRQCVLEEDPLIASAAPLAVAAVRHVGHRATRAMGTVGGSLAHSDPAAELPAVMVALGASVRTVSASAGERTIRCAELFSGYFTTCLAHDEIISSIHIPVAPAGSGASWCEWAPRSGDFADAGVGVSVDPGPDGSCSAVGAAASGVAPTPIDLTSVLTPLLEGVSRPEAGVLRAVASAVEAECSSELAGLLAARAVYRALTAMAAAGAAGRASGAAA